MVPKVMGSVRQTYKRFDAPFSTPELILKLCNDEVIYLGE